MRKNTYNLKIINSNTLITKHSFSLPPNLNMKQKKIYRAIFIFTMLIFSIMFACGESIQHDPYQYAVLLGLNPEDSAILTSYDTVVIDAQYFTNDEIAAVQAKGTAIYTYLNIGSIETFREGYDSLKQFALSPYDDWPDEYWVDVSRPEWQSFIAAEAQALVKKGVDGFFLDNADVYYLYPTSAIYDGLVTMIQSLGQYEKPILINGGDVFVSKAILESESPLSCVTGVNQECVFTNIDFSTGLLIRQSKETKQYYQDYLAKCKDAGLHVFLTEYAPGNSSVETSIQEYCSQNGFTYYLSHSIDLDGT